MLLDYLKTRYSLGEPIFSSDIDYPNMSSENLRYHLKRLTDSGELKRFDSGVYYLPEKGDLKGLSSVSAEAVAVGKYILRKGKRIGYYSGYTLANRLGLSMQVPLVEEIVSNNAPAPVREVVIGNREYLLRKPVMEITDENVAVLQLLDCLKDIDRCSDKDYETSGAVLNRFVKSKGITKQMIRKTIERFPTRVYKAIYDIGIEYVST